MKTTTYLSFFGNFSYESCQTVSEKVTDQLLSEKGHRGVHYGRVFRLVAEYSGVRMYEDAKTARVLVINFEGGSITDAHQLYTGVSRLTDAACPVRFSKMEIK